MWEPIPRPLLTNHSRLAVRVQIISLKLDGLVVPKLPACKDVSCHQQEVTDGQLVTMSLVPGTVDSDVASECHLFWPPPLPTEKVSSVDKS